VVQFLCFLNTINVYVMVNYVDILMENTQITIDLGFAFKMGLHLVIW